MMKKKYIKSVVEYLTWVKEVHSSQSNKIDWDIRNIYYRGQACSSWKLNAGIFREKNQGLSESEMLSASNKYLWNELTQYQTYWDKLSFFQHYGLPTRLLDVTTNPLIALFFACEKVNVKGRERNRAVYVCYKESRTIEIEKLSQTIFEKSFDGFNGSIDLVERSFGDYRLFSQNFIIEPPMSNSRIATQNGAYIFTKVLDECNGIWIKYIDGDVKDMFEDRCAIIPTSCKGDILKELREYGIHEGTIFSDIAHKLSYIRKAAYDKSL